MAANAKRDETVDSNGGFVTARALTVAARGTQRARPNIGDVPLFPHQNAERGNEGRPLEPS